MTEIHIFRLALPEKYHGDRYQAVTINYAGTVEFVSKMQADVENHARNKSDRGLWTI